MKKVKFVIFNLLILGFLTVSVSAQDAQKLLEQGLANFDAKKFDQCRENFKRVIEINPKVHQAHFNLGLSFYYSRKYPEAIESFDRTIWLDSTIPNAFLYKGSSLFRLERLMKL